MAGREDVFKQAMNEGHSAAWDQNWEQASAAYARALTEFPDHARALNSYALSQYQLQKFDMALKVYIRVARVTPKDPVAFEKIAQIYERLGNLKEAIQAALYAAELNIKLQDMEKAIENWNTVLQLDPENLQARSRLALNYEKSGRNRMATGEFIAVAGILQSSGDQQKAMEVLEHAIHSDPVSEELQLAIKMLSKGTPLPKPLRPRGGTGPLRMAAVMEMGSQSPRNEQVDGLDPVREARQTALKVFADFLFENNDKLEDPAARRGISLVINPEIPADPQSEKHARIVKYLSDTIDAQTKENETAAIVELEKALKEGYNEPAAHYDLGLLLSNTFRMEDGLQHLQQCSNQKEYSLAARLVTARILVQMGKVKHGAITYLEGLQLADCSIVEAGSAELLKQLYEPLIDYVRAEKGKEPLQKLSENIESMLVRPKWRQYLKKLRAELQPIDGQLLPVAELIIPAQSSHVLESMKLVRQLAEKEQLRSAVDEAFRTVQYAPNYLPLHLLIAELLLQEGHPDEAIVKLNVVANTFTVRGEPAQAILVLRRLLQLSPMDIQARDRLIKQLLESGMEDDAIREYMELADMYIRLSELDQARTAFSTALHVAGLPNTQQAWSVSLLGRMADIDMQRLDWRQAIRVFEQLRTLNPEDFSVWQNLIELNLRLDQVPQAKAEIEAFISYLERSHAELVIPFLTKIKDGHPDLVMVECILAEQMHKQGQTSEAVAMLDALGDRLLDAGDKVTLRDVVNQILSMDPPNGDDYRELLSRL